MASRRLHVRLCLQTPQMKATGLGTMGRTWAHSLAAEHWDREDTQEHEGRTDPCLEVRLPSNTVRATQSCCPWVGGLPSTH